MQFRLRSLFILMAFVCAFVAALSTFGRPGGTAVIGIAGYVIVVFCRDRPVLQRATVLLFGSFGSAMIAASLRHVVHQQNSFNPLFFGLTPRQMLPLGTAFFVGAVMAYVLFIRRPPAAT